MRVSENRSDSQADATEKPKASRSTVKTKAKAAAAEEGAETKETAKTAKATKAEKAAEKAEAKKAAAGASVKDRDAEVMLSAKGKAASMQDREVKEANTLMDHVEGGKLGESENNLAMDRISAILKKYGKA